MEISSPFRVERRVVGISAITAALYFATWLLEASLPRQAARGAWLFALYTSTTLLIFWAYGALIAIARRNELRGRARLWALLFPVGLNLVFLAWAPMLSQDTLSYLAQGLLGYMPGSNPLLDAVQEVRDTPFGSELMARGWTTFPGITPYGILWTRVEVLVVAICGTNITAGLLLFKAIAVVASLGSAGLIWQVLGRINPPLQLAGTLAYLWNPLVLTEFAVEGHNDAVMIFFSIAAFAAAIAARPGVSLVAQLLGAMAKYISILFLLPQMVFLWRTQPDKRRLVAHGLVAAIVIVALLFLLYAPFWAGLHSLDGLLNRRYPFGSMTFFGISRWVLHHTALSPIAGPMTTAFVVSLQLALVAWCAVRVRDAEDLARSCAWIALAFLLVASPDYWPWYACMVVAWICLGDLNRLFWLVLLLSVAGRLTGPLEIMRVAGYLGDKLSKGLITGLGALVPLFALLTWVFLRWTFWRPAFLRDTK
jgi:alpha-1,6-mannosyltransferase